MEKESLYIYKLDEQGHKAKFPNSDMPAKLGEYTYSAQRMAGTPTLTATLNYHVCLDDLWNGEEFVEFRGEKYYVDQTPTSSKDNKSIMYKHELQFVSERIVLENVYFMDVVTAGEDTYHSNSTSVKFMGDINEFVGRLNASMAKSGIGYSVVIDEDITSESKLVSLDSVYLAEALQSIYTVYELPYYFVGKVCHIGYTENVISTPFEYKKGLVSIKKINANYKIVNRVTGVGSSDNIPFYYPNDDEKGTIERTQNLMPSIYRQTNGAERFYNALNDTYKIPGTNDYYSFKNTYSSKKVKEIKVDFSDIKPTIEGVTNASGQMFGEIADIAFDTNDSDELGTGTGNNVFNGTDEYVHSYFYIKLHIYDGYYGFNLFKQGLEGGTAVINMTTGNCAACEFEIGVTYKDNEPGRAFNPVLVNEDGNLLAGDFEQKVTSQPSQYVDRQQDTSTNEVWIAVKKDNTSFGIVMPNVNNDYKPSKGDKFVITGIKMPKPIVLAAEKRLDEALIKYMSENNDEKFTFSVNFSRIFLAENSYLWDVLNENARIYIKYNNREYLMYVNSFTCKADKNCLYDMSVELTDKLSARVSALRSTIAEIAGDIIGSTLDKGTNNYNDWFAKASRRFLRKDLPDTASEDITFKKGAFWGNFVSGSTGGCVFVDKETGQSYAEFDKLKVRMKAYFENLEIQNVNSVGGKIILTPGGAVELILVWEKGLIEVTKERPMVDGEGNPVLDEEGNPVMETYTEQVDNGVPEGVWRCFFLGEQDGVEVDNRFRAGYQAQSKNFNIKSGGHHSVTNHYYWRLVTEASKEVVDVDGKKYHYIDLSKTDGDTGSDYPAIGDTVAHLGARITWKAPDGSTKTDEGNRDAQNAIVFSSVDAFSPSVTLYHGIDSYSYLDKEYVEYGVNKTTNKAFFHVYGDAYIGDRDGGSYVKFVQGDGVEIKGKLSVGTTIGNGDTLEEALKKASESYVEDVTKLAGYVENSVSDLQSQIDGSIETWFYEPVPTLENVPASQWITDETKNVHLGDLYYDGKGKVYRFQHDDDEGYYWIQLSDTDIAKALELANQAQDTADGKRRVFVRQPLASEAYDIGDMWVNATYGELYSDDVLRAKTAKSKGSSFDISHWQLASKYTDDTVAKAAQKAAQEAKENINELSSTVTGMREFTDTAFSDGIITRSEATAIEKYLNQVEALKKAAKGSYDEVYNNPMLKDGEGDSTAKINLKSYYNKFETAASELNTSISEAISDGKATDMEIADVDMKYSNFNTAYGEFYSYLNAAIKYIEDKIYDDTEKALSQIGELSYVKEALLKSTQIEGGLILSSMMALRDNEGDVMSGINGIFNPAELGGGIGAWWGGKMVDQGFGGSGISSDFDKEKATSLIRFDGSGYLANGAVWWDVTGNVHADPLSFFVGEEYIGHYMRLFQFVYDEGTGHKWEDVRYVIPQQPFQKLDIASEMRIGEVVVKKHSDRVVELDGDLIVTGSITIFAQGSHTASTILDALPIDETTLSKEGNKLSVIGGVGGGSVDGIILNGKTYSPDEETKLITLPDYPTSMDWGSITNTPSTLAGYGITDAYTKAESNANYVIKSGDTMSGTLFIDMPANPFLRFRINGLNKGEIGAGNNNVYIWNSARNNYLRYENDGTLTFERKKILHEGNYSGVLDNRYVNKSGDTMTGDLLFSAGKGIASSTGVMEVGRYSGTIYLQGNSLYYSPSNGTNYTVWHAGNDGSGSGLDADMLDGLHYTSFARKDAWQANNLNDINDTGIMTNYANADATVKRNYPIQEAGILIYGTAAYNSSNQIYGTYASNRWFARGGGSSAQNKTSWREFAFTDSNVASATRLQTARTIWGQSFDGTSNISGWLSGATTIECSTGVRCRNICIETESDGTAGSRGSEINCFTSPLYLQHATSYGVIMCNGGGRVGIGVTPDYKLHVGGDIKANSWSLALNFNVYDTNISLCSNNGHMELDSYGSELVVTGGTDMHVNMRAGIRGNIPTTWLFHAGSDSSYANIMAGYLFSYGLVQSISNGITSSFGAQNSSYCHISTNAPAFWFSSELRINGSILPYDGNHWIGTADSPWGYVFSNGWFRSLGNTGWYNQTYSGGIYMTDSTYVRVYSKEWFRSDMYSAGRGGYQDDAYSAAYNACVSGGDSYCCYSFVRYGVMPFGIGFNTDNEIWLGVPNTNRIANEQWLKIGRVGMEYVGNFLTHGGITMYYSSDKNLKANIRPVTNASERLMSIGGVYDFEYIDSEVERNSIYAGTHTGLIYQNVKGGVMDCMAYEREDGKGALNYIDPSFISLLAAVEIEHEGRIQVLESENKMLKANNEKLMNRINELERRIA